MQKCSNVSCCFNSCGECSQYYCWPDEYAIKQTLFEVSAEAQDKLQSLRYEVQEQLINLDNKLKLGV